MCLVLLMLSRKNVLGETIHDLLRHLAKRAPWWVWTTVAAVLAVPMIPSAWVRAAALFAVGVLAGLAAGPALPLAGARVGAGAGALADALAGVPGHATPLLPAGDLRRYTGKRWEAACLECGLDRNRKGDKDDGPRRIPTLLRRGGVHRDGPNVVLTMVPRDDWDDRRCAEAASLLANHYGAHTVRHRTFIPTRRRGWSGRTGRLLEVRLGMEPLPRRADWRTAGAGDGWPVGVLAGGGEARLVLGDRQPAHALVTGSSGSGKTVVLRSLVYHAARDGWDVLVVDPNGSIDFHGLGATVVTDAAAAADQLAGLVEDRQSRLDRLNQGGRVTPRLVVVDEAASILSDDPGLDREDRQRCQRAIRDIAQRGRAARTHLILTIQRPDVKLLGPSGGFIRGQLDAVVFLDRRPDDDGLGMAFGKGRVQPQDLAALRSGGPGRCLVAGLTPADLGGGADVIPCQAYYFPEDLGRGGGPVADEPEPAPVRGTDPADVDVDAVGTEVDGVAAGGLGHPLDDVILVGLADGVPRLRAEVARLLGRRDGDGTVGRRLAKLEAHGLLVRDPGDRRYRPGPLFPVEARDAVRSAAEAAATRVPGG